MLDINITQNNENKRKINLILALNAIKDGINSLDGLSKHLNISKVTAINLTQALLNKRLIVMETEPEGRTGRRTNLYRIEDNYHTMFFEQVGRTFRCISIDIKGRVVDRFDFVIIPRLSMKDNLKVLYGRFKKNRNFGKYCVDVFAVCNDETAKLLPKSTKVMTKENIILSCLSEDDKAILFKLDNKYAMSLYSHIHYLKSGIGEKTIHKAIDFDKEYSFCKELYDGIFLSLEKHSLNKLTDLI